MNIKKILELSLTIAAMKHDLRNKSPRLINRNRSKNFVEILADQLRKEYKDGSNIYVLSRHYNKNRKLFGLNELLYDILVFETSPVLSIRKTKSLLSVTKAIWTIESELDNNSKEWIKDFNKLVLGSSVNKLFIGPQYKPEKEILCFLTKLAEHCNGNIFLALVPYPRDLKPEALVHCWEFKKGWQEL